MKKHLLIILSIIAINAYAMEIKTINLSPYPIDILDLIASFLTFNDIESEEEFIKRATTSRTSICNGTPKKCKELIPKSYTDKDTNYFGAYCPNRILFTALKGPYNNDGATNALTIIDTKKKEKLREISFKTATDYRHLALSRHGNAIATIHFEEDYSAKIRRSKPIITVKNIVTHKTETVNFPPCFSIASDALIRPIIAFNKQGTLLIIRGHDHFPYDDLPENEWFKTEDHKIIPLTIKISNTSPNKKTSEHWFAQKGICKNLQLMQNKK